MGGCQNYGPFLGTLNIRCRIIIGIQKGTIILTTTQMLVLEWSCSGRPANALDTPEAPVAELQGSGLQAIWGFPKKGVPLGGPYHKD